MVREKALGQHTCGYKLRRQCDMVNKRCLDCDESFETVKILMEHMKTIHNERLVSTN